tara:strand:+ start:2075 stop:3466 length:1392 start_codon:yes stop_codon:yes gene_type:complete
MKLKHYPKYKDSGIQWIGEIPEKWNYYRCKFLLSSLQSGSRETGGGAQIDEGIFSLGGEHINWDGTLKLDNPKLISEEYYNSMNQGKLKIDDILLVKDGATIGKTAILKKKKFDKMAVNEHVFLIRPNKKISAKLLYYLICSDSGFKQIKLTEVGSAQGGINTDFISKISFSIPEEKETQGNIISFLDKKTSEINDLIEKDRKLIKLLKEKRVVLINRVVTKGLDPKVKMKDSGIDWIGEIPERWSKNKIKNTSYVKGRIGWHGLNSEEYSDKGAYLVTGTDFEYGKIDWNTCHHIGWDRYKEDPYIHLRENDLLITKDGTIGKVTLIDKLPDKATLNSGIFLVRPLNMKYEPKFMYWLLNSLVFERFFDYIKTGATISHLYQETFERFFFPIPSKEEQTQIVRYLDKVTSKIDKTTKKIQERINLMEEYKKSLIHHVVTGKVDVRGWLHNGKNKNEKTKIFS